jgi:hypothetical protein
VLIYSDNKYINEFYALKNMLQYVNISLNKRYIKRL